MRWPILISWLSFIAIVSGAESPPTPPPPRTYAEVQAVLKGSPPVRAAASPRVLKVALVASKKDHGPGEHDYPAWQTNWLKLLSKAEGVKVSTAWPWPSAEQLKDADVLVFYYWNHAWTAERYRELDGFLARGGGVVSLHSASIADKEPEPLAERIGLAFQPGRSKYRHGPLVLKVVAPASHPITRGLPPQIPFVDESYWPMIGDVAKVDVLATADEEGKPWPMIWTMQQGRGRVFGSILGHYSWTFDDPFYRILVLRGIAWSAGEPASRLDNLATNGVGLKAAKD